jgi:polar amino acid transport system substrate-binding protein
MRKFLVGLVAMAFIAVACGSNDNTSAGSTGSTGSTGATGATGSSPTAVQTAADCAQSATLTTSGTLTIGTDNPAYPPYFEGGTTKGSEWKLNDPTTGKGFESAVAYAVADQLGFSVSQVKWIVAPFVTTYAPGTKSWDFAIEQISYSAKRAQAVDLSDSYWDVNQALVAVKGTPITNATSISDLKNYTIAAAIGTTSYSYITDVIGAKPGAYQTVALAVAALNAGQVDGLLIDLPTALYMADPYVQEVKNSVVVGQFAPQTGGKTDHVSIALQKGSSFTACINLALAELKASGKLQALTTEWLSKKTNVGTVPEFTS